MPLGLRRKLDIAGLKFPLEMWQALSFEERCSLCEEEPDVVGVEAYRARVHTLAQNRPGQLQALPPLPNPRPWATQEAAARVGLRCEEAGRPFSEAQWQTLNDEWRYILWRLSEARRGVQKLLAALQELLGENL